jgi:uncharacterized protein YcgI (DUF1989 family)
LRGLDDKRLNASTAQPSATTGEHHQQVAAQTAEQLRGQDTLEIQKMMLLQQLQERRSSISSPLSGGSDRDRMRTHDAIAGHCLMQPITRIEHHGAHRASHKCLKRTVNVYERCVVLMTND